MNFDGYAMIRIFVGQKIVGIYHFFSVPAPPCKIKLHCTTRFALNALNLIDEKY